MPKRQQLTDFQRGVIVGCRISGKSLREISVLTGHPRSTVQDVVRKYEQNGATTAAPRSGRPRVMSQRDKCALSRVVLRNRKSTLQDITVAVARDPDDCSTTVAHSPSVRTVQRVLHEMGFFGRAGKRKPFISKVNALRRLRWCTERRHWTSDDWAKIMWSDESRFTLQQSDGRVWIWRRPNEKYDPECLVPTVKDSGGGVMVWATFCAAGVGPITGVDMRLNAPRYQALLTDHLPGAMAEFYGTSQDCFFQQDNAPCHAARSTKAWFTHAGIQLLPWPAQSPDLNPIEALWDVLERRVRMHEPPVTNRHQLLDCLKTEWQHIPPEECRKLVDSLPRRVAAVIAAKGGPTRY